MSLSKYYHCFLFFLFLLTSSLAHTEPTYAPYAFLYDYDTQKILFEKNADQPMPPASMTKMMTAYMIFDALKKNKISLNDTFPVSEKAWRKGGTKMFVEVGKFVRVEDIIRGIIVQSGNDACIVAAEALAYDESSFAQQMTEKARDLGLTESVFKNASGWPDPDHKVTAKELAKLAAALIRDFPEYYHYFSETSFTYNNIRQFNRNILLDKLSGLDGLKTGHTEEAGYGITISAKRKEQRLIAVVNGLPNEKERIKEAEKLINWGFQEYENILLFKKDQFIENITIWAGKKEALPLNIPHDIMLTLPRGGKKNIQISLEYLSPIIAPIKKGDAVAILHIIAPDNSPLDITLTSQENIDKLGFFAKKWYSLSNMINILFK